MQSAAEKGVIDQQEKEEEEPHQEEEEQQQHPHKEEGQEQPPYMNECCTLCKSTPCVMHQGLWDELAKITEEIDKYQDHHDNELTPQAIRFRLYREASTWIHGYLGRTHRQPLPQCVVSNIRNIAPNPTGTSYVGFKSHPNSCSTTSNHEQKENEKNNNANKKEE